MNYTAIITACQSTYEFQFEAISAENARDQIVCLLYNSERYEAFPWKDSKPNNFDLVTIKFGITGSSETKIVSIINSSFRSIIDRAADNIRYAMKYSSKDFGERGSISLIDSKMRTVFENGKMMNEFKGKQSHAEIIKLCQD